MLKCHLLWEALWDLPLSQDHVLLTPLPLTLASALLLSTQHSEGGVCTYTSVSLSRAGLDWCRLPECICGCPEEGVPRSRHQWWAGRRHFCQTLLGGSGSHGLVTGEGFQNLYSVLVWATLSMSQPVFQSTLDFPKHL